MSIYDGKDINPDDYEIGRVPDTAELARLLMKAKGPTKNMSDFAEECGTSPSTFSRIANCKITQSITKDLIMKIAEHADPESGVEARQLFYANGMVSKEENRRLADRDPFSRLNDIKNMLISDLVERGNTIQLLRQIDDPEASRYIRSTGNSNLLLRVYGCETEYWKFRIVGMQGFSIAGRKRGEELPNPHRRNYRAEARMLLSRLAEVFLEDVWYPAKLKMCKLSFVFESEGFYREFNELIKEQKFNNWFSTILVDAKRRHVIEEYVFERYDGKEMKSPLNYPLMPNTDEDWGTEVDEFYGSILGEDDE